MHSMCVFRSKIFIGHPGPRALSFSAFAVEANKIFAMSKYLGSWRADLEFLLLSGFGWCSTGVELLFCPGVSWKGVSSLS